MAEESSLDRREVVARLLARRESLLVVTGLGSPTYDVHAAGDHDGNFYLWGAMGSAALIGLGLAQAQPDRRVVVITGDGEQLMGLGGLATIAVSNPDNLVVVVIDNDHFGETGMQTSHTGHGLDLASVAQSCGFAETRTVRDMAGVDRWRARSIRDPPGALLCNQGEVGESAALAAASRRRAYQEQVPGPSGS